MASRTLKQEEVAAVLAVHYACGGDVLEHQPIEHIRSEFTRGPRPEAKRIVERTARHLEQYILKHKNKLSPAQQQSMA